MTDLIDTTEMYLRTIFELEEEGIVPMRARIAERLGHSGPTVSQTVARMARDGLVLVSDDRHLQLTVDGRTKATRVMRKHRLAERLLLDVIGLEWQYVHDEACRWEHVMSDRVERKLLTLLKDTTESPYGNPIPGLDELGGADAEGFRDGVLSLTEVVQSDQQVRHEVVVRRLGEPIQSDIALLERLGRLPLRPGRRVAANLNEGAVRIQVDDQVLELTLADAQHVFVERDVAVEGDSS